LKRGGLVMVSSLVIFIDSKENSVGQNLVAGSNSI
jgi:hypothetical protein